MTFTAFLFRTIYPDESLVVAGKNVGVVFEFYNSE